MKLVLLLTGLLSAGVARAEEPTTRTMLDRIDTDARSVRLHPTNATGPAQALSRAANDAAARLRKEGLPDEGAALKREAASLAAAARKDEEKDVRAHALHVEELIHQLDDQLP